MEEGDLVPSLFMFGGVSHNSNKGVAWFFARNADGPYVAEDVSSGRTRGTVAIQKDYTVKSISDKKSPR
ncbi:MAG: hypothetical protein Q3993_00545 [Filifactor alocis]|nr:hypothetical protein [Filifactor alocis]